MLMWSDDQIARFFHLSSPEAPTVISWAIPLFLGFVTLLLYHTYHSGVLKVAESNVQIAGQERGLAVSVAPRLLIDFFEKDDKYERLQYTNGIVRRAIHISVLNNGLDDIHDCNIKLIAATPRPKTGDTPTDFPVYFGANFDLQGKKRQFIKIVSFVENPGNTDVLERDNVFISAAVGGFFGGWTTVPIPMKDSPAILTLEAFAPSVASKIVHLHLWVDQRRLHAKIV